MIINLDKNDIKYIKNIRSENQNIEMGFSIDKNINIEKGKEMTIRGFCTGNGITGVSLTDCIIKVQ